MLVVVAAIDVIPGNVVIRASDHADDVAEVGGMAVEGEGKRADRSSSRT